MANLICELEGVRGRTLRLYDTKIVITTKKSIGSLLTGNITDGEKTIYLCDIVGVQYKKSDLLIGYLQFETPSMQMNNKNDNFFSENTFTYESGKNGITNEIIDAVYNYVTDRVEELKYGNRIINEIPDFESMKTYSGDKKGDTPQTVATQVEEQKKTQAKVYVVGSDISAGTYTIFSTDSQGGMIYIHSLDNELLDRRYIKTKEKIRLKSETKIKLINCDINFE